MESGCFCGEFNRHVCYFLLYGCLLVRADETTSPGSGYQLGEGRPTTIAPILVILLLVAMLMEFEMLPEL